MDALSGVGGVRTVLGLHENVVTGAGDGYARMARRPAMTLLHLGPGLANGLANLHNAKRASSPMLNLIGTMATWHTAADASLQMDVESLTQTVSCWASLLPSRELLHTFAREAIARVSAFASPDGCRIATLLLPHDLQWQICSHSGAHMEPSLIVPSSGGGVVAIDALLQDLAEAGRRGALLLGGEALCEPMLSVFASYARCVGTAILCVNEFARADRGQGRPAVRRIPYHSQQAREFLESFTVMVFINAVEPTAQFGYPESISTLVSSHSKIHRIPFAELSAVLHHLQGAISRDAAGELEPMAFPSNLFPPDGILTAPKMWQLVAGLQPLDTIIIVDESLTSGGEYWEASQHSPPFSHLSQTRGAFRNGPPCAVGAALACPDRHVINLQADSSGLYSSQALSTQARERLNITTVVCANNAYGILQVDLARQKPKFGGRGCVVNALTQLNDPPIDWVNLAAGYGVLAVTVNTCEELARELSTAIDAQGPRVIVASLRTLPSAMVDGNHNIVHAYATSAPYPPSVAEPKFDCDPWNILQAAAERQPTHVALMQELEAVLSYGEVRTMALHLAACLHERGTRGGGRIAALSANCWQLIPLHYAVAALRCAILNINTRLASQVRLT